MTPKAFELWKRESRAEVLQNTACHKPLQLHYFQSYTPSALNSRGEKKRRGGEMLKCGDTETEEIWKRYIWGE